MEDRVSELDADLKADLDAMIRILHEERYYGPYRLDYVDASGKPRAALVKDDGSVEELAAEGGPDIDGRTR